MNDSFEKKVGAAAVAGWWVVLIALGYLLILWIAYLIIVPARPAWLAAMWGPGIEWPFIQNVWFWGIAGFKLCWWLLVFVVQAHGRSGRHGIGRPAPAASAQCCTGPGSRELRPGRKPRRRRRVKHEWCSDRTYLDLFG